MSLRRGMFMALGASAGGGTTLLQTVKIMFTADGAFRTDTNWNTIDQSFVNTQLSNFDGFLTNFYISISGDDWDIDGYPGNVADPAGDFSLVSLAGVVYTYNGGRTKTITITGLNAAKYYEPKVGVLYYDDPAGENKTNVTINGVTKQLLLSTANVPYIQLFDKITGVTTLTMVVDCAPGAIYAIISGLILREYQ